MNAPRVIDTRPPGYPKFINHESFEEADASELYNPDAAPNLASYSEKYMPDEVTRDYARRMHYAGYRLRKAKGLVEVDRWRTAYLHLRDQIVVGNRKLIYRAVRRQMQRSNQSDDSIGDCHIVLIQAVAAYNPWIGIRFSTYAYTCLIRALHRQSQRQMKDRLSHCLSLDSLADAPPNRFDHTLVSTGSLRIEEYLKADHPLLTHREKFVITRRFIQAEETPHTLEKVGEALGLSKERVRQVQASALTKLRLALAETAST